MLTTPMKSPFEEYYRQRELEEQQSHQTSRKRSRNEERSSTWDPTEQKKLRQDVEEICDRTLKVLQANAKNQCTITLSSHLPEGFEDVIRPSDGSPCSVCTSYTDDQGLCQVCSTRVCPDCIFQCELCAQICCSICKFNKYYGKDGETAHCPDCL